MTYRVAIVVLCLCSFLQAQDCNLKTVTDASPDYSDMPSLVHSISSRWETPAEKSRRASR